MGRTGLLERGVSCSATPFRMTMRPRWLSGFWLKNSRMKVCRQAPTTAARLGLMSSTAAALDKSTTT